MTPKFKVGDRVRVKDRFFSDQPDLPKLWSGCAGVVTGVFQDEAKYSVILYSALIVVEEKYLEAVEPQPKGGSMLTIKPRHKQVLVKLRQKPEVSAGGIVTSFNEASRIDHTRGVVVAVGPDVNTRKDDKKVPKHSGNILTPGMHVMLNVINFAAAFKLDGVDHVVLDENQVIAVVEE